MGAEFHTPTAFEIAADFLTSINKPNPCLVCNGKVEPEKMGKEAMLSLEYCFHVFHAAERIVAAKWKMQTLQRGPLGRLLGEYKCSKSWRIGLAVSPFCRTEFDADNADHELTQAKLTKLDESFRRNVTFMFR